MQKINPPLALSFVFLLIQSWLLLSNTWKFLNSDVIIYSMMSQFNVTKFYWGQERILNVLPFIFSPVKDPSTNLYLLAYTAAFSHYLLLLIFVMLSNKFLNKRAFGWSAVFIFMIVSVLSTLMLSPYALFEIGVYHPEWSLAIIFGILSILTFKTSWKWWVRLPTAYLLFGIAMGLNFSVALIVAAIVGFLFFSNIFGWRDLIAWAAIGCSVSILWIIDSNDLRSRSFTNFQWDNYSPLIGISITNTLNVFQPLISLIIVLIISAFSFYTFISRPSKIPKLTGQNKFLLSRITAYVSLISSVWLLFFAQNDWVVINSNHFRYFIPMIYAFLFLLTLYIAYLFSAFSIGAISTTIAIAISVALAIITGWLPQAVNFKEAGAIKFAQELAPQGEKFAAGDFWVTWPYVYGNLLDGKKVESLALRSEVNIAKTQQLIQKELNKNSIIRVVCFGEDLELCKNQVQFHAGEPLVAREIESTDTATHLEFVR